jgi:hypothetical protein
MYLMNKNFCANGSKNGDNYVKESSSIRKWKQISLRFSVFSCILYEELKAEFHN